MSYYAALCNISEPSFRRLFKEYTGQTPIEYRNSIRIANLQRLLSSGEFKINEAAYLVGFNNMSFFYEVYNNLGNNYQYAIAVNCNYLSIFPLFFIENYAL